MNTPKTEFVAQQCSTDGEYSDVQAYNVMYAHARQLETQVQELREALEAIAVQPMSNDWSRQVARAILEKTK